MKRPELPYPLEFLFDRKAGYEGHATSIYYEVVKKLDPDGVLLGDMGFGSKLKDAPLQMANVLVGFGARDLHRQRAIGPNAPKQKSLLQMNKRGRMFFNLLDASIFRSLMDQLRRAQRQGRV